jgi:2-amino-4-hydroxy-6-hydroxymethyldihydropteridine diphosphokinase
MLLFSIGSNLNPAENFAWALETLLARYQKLLLSHIAQTAPVGMVSQNAFWNAVGAFATSETTEAVKLFFNELEAKAGRDRRDPQRKTKDRVLDLDILGWQADFVDKSAWPHEGYIRPFFVEVWQVLQGETPLPTTFGQRLTLASGLICGEKPTWLAMP